jgi:hypothetical protein
MPLIKSHTDEAREKNIKEMIASGHDPEQAVAAGYANQRKYKKMAEGGILEEEMEHGMQDTIPKGLVEHNIESQPFAESEQEEMLAGALADSDKEEAAEDIHHFSEGGEMENKVLSKEQIEALKKYKSSRRLR